MNAGLIRRRWRAAFSLLSIACVWLATCPAASGQQQRGDQPGRRRPPNIIIIQADDLGYGDLSCYGQQRFRTPNLDRMAAQGVRFTDYYAGSTVCAPSRAALMTGLHTGHARIRGNGEYPLLPDDVTVAQVLKKAGYRTAVVGKWGLGLEDNTGRPDLQGFDESFGYLHHVHAHRQYTSFLWRNGERHPTDSAKDYVNDLFTGAALDFVGRNKTRPFFLYLSYTAPHAELRIPEDSLGLYRGKFREVAPFVNRRGDAIRSEDLPPWRQGTYRSQATPRAAFAAMVTRLDRDVGRILARLREQGLDRDTVVFFTSDNGPHQEGGADPVYFNSAGALRGLKRDLYEGGIRVPMIVRWPGRIQAGRVSDQVWAHWDFLPTAADIAGTQAPQRLDGISMLNALGGARQSGHKFLYWEFHERGFDQAVRMGDWKAVRHGSGAPLELYNLRRDVGERYNVAMSHPDVVSIIEAYLKTARTESPLWKIKTE